MLAFYNIEACAASSSSSTCFEVDKIPIDSVKIKADCIGNLKCGDVVTLGYDVFPENAKYTILDELYRIVDGSEYATICDNELIINDSAPLGVKIEVVCIIDSVESENSLIFTITRTPVEYVEFSNTENSITIGGAIKLNVQIFPENATDKHISYSIVSDTEYMNVSYSGILSFNGKTIPEGDLFVTVRASSTNDPDVYTDKTFVIYRPVIEPIDATRDLTEVQQQCAYYFNTNIGYLKDIFGRNAVKYSVNVGQNIATIDTNGLLYITSNAPIGTEITVLMSSYNEEITYEQTVVVVPVFATSFTPIVETTPDIIFPNGEYYYAGSEIEFDVVSYLPLNVTDANKVFTLHVSNEDVAYVVGNKVIVRDASEINPGETVFTVTVLSEPNGLEEKFDIMIYIPVDSLSAECTLTNVIENQSYALSDLLKLTVVPENATVLTINYGLDLGDGVASIKDNQLIVKDDLPSGNLTVVVYAEINGVRSNSLEINLYKPTQSVNLSVEVNGIILSDENLPHSYKNNSDVVRLITKVDCTASINLPTIVVSSGSDYIDGDIKLINTTVDGFACFEFKIKKNLGSVPDFNRIIKLYATQDGVQSEESLIEIYIPDEDFSLTLEQIDRGNHYQFVSTHTLNATDKTWEFMLDETAKELGVLVVSNDTIFVPKNITFGTSILVYYRSLDGSLEKIFGDWRMAEFTIAPAVEFSQIIYEGKTLKNGFNFVYSSDSNGIQISEAKPQLWVGRYVDIEIKYINDFISAYGMSISDVKVSGSGYEDKNYRTDGSVRIYMNSNAKGNESINISITISDGTESYTFNAGNVSAFRPISGKLVLNKMTINGQNIADLVNKSSSSFDFNSTYGLGGLSYSMEASKGIEITSGGKVTIKSYAIRSSYNIKYVCTEYYNKIAIEYSEKSTLSIKTIKINKDGGTGGYNEIVAVRGMKNLGSREDLSSISPSRSGYVISSFGSYIDKNGKVQADYNDCGELKVQWLKVHAVWGSGDRTQKVTHNDKFTEVIYPSLSRDELKSYGFTHLSVTIVFDCKEKNDGYQDLWVYSHKDKEVYHTYVEHGEGKKDTSWWSHTVTFQISLDDVQTDGSFWLKWGSHGKLWDTWYLGKTTVTVDAIVVEK